jgi:DNA replication protein DnaC
MKAERAIKKDDFPLKRISTGTTSSWRNKKMDNLPVRQLRYLGFLELAENWTHIIKKATRYRPSYQKFLSELIETEYEHKVEKARLARIKRARIPEVLLMETFPFDKQPRLKKKLVLDLYDSLEFMRDHQDLIFIGPTGCGKTGLATAFLVHALNQGFRGLFVDFKDLLNTLHQSQGDYSEARLMKRFASYDVLLIDELGYLAGKKEHVPLFFDLMRRREKGRTTIITTQLGFDEWGSFLHDPHLAAALLDRITVNCAVFNMKDCISIRPKNIVYATTKQPSTD